MLGFLLPERSSTEGRSMKNNFTNKQIIYILGQAESGTSVAEVCRKMGITEQTYYRL
jgi:transposase-like protein